VEDDDMLAGLLVVASEAVEELYLLLNCEASVEAPRTSAWCRALVRSKDDAYLPLASEPLYAVVEPVRGIAASPWPNELSYCVKAAPVELRDKAACRGSSISSVTKLDPPKLSLVNWSKLLLS
jgi:hypothetical protein